MPDKSCRTCGGDLVKLSTCSDCRKVIQKICRTCNLKTVEDFHSHHVSLESCKILETKSTIATIQSYSNTTDVKKYRKNHHNTNHTSNILVAFGIIMGVIILGISGISYLGTSYNHISTESKMTLSPVQPDGVQTVKETYHANTLQPIDHVVGPTYSNCLGSANGDSLTITCPTTYGNVYKAVVNIPSGLISQFENNVFNLRDLSIIEHVDSISIQYEKITYEAKFVNS